MTFSSHGASSLPSPAFLSSSASARSRVGVTVSGAVQGVGFRPFVYRIAREERLGGWVCNTPEGVRIEVEGAPERVECFLGRLRGELPPHAALDRVAVTPLEAVGQETGEFRIVQSTERGTTASVVVQPDLSTCPECLEEIRDPANRRYRYPFTNCTHCGPRYSIIAGLPYDRELTTMKSFIMCPECRAEYENPADRRFHAQPNACPACGPQLEYWEGVGTREIFGEEALLRGAAALRAGRIVAVKGIGGFHLMVDARNEEAVARLRERKRRPDKPLAVMAPDLPQARRIGAMSETEEALLTSSEAPIVLLRQREQNGLAPSVAPGNPLVGLLLPHAPLQHLLLGELGVPVVATSGNLTDDPICTDEEEAVSRLAGIADALLVHNRPIARPLDDSIVRVMNGHPALLRVGRGYAPVRIPVAGMKAGLLGVGAHQKATVALSLNGAVVVGQHLGDLDSALSVANHASSAAKLSDLYSVAPSAAATDLHPDYTSTRYALATGLPRTAVQHHHAHVLACLAENGIVPPVLGVSWDGTGLGTDSTVWGGEFLRVTRTGFERVASLRTFVLPGGDAASRDPRRSCFGLLAEMHDAGFARVWLVSRGLLSETEGRMLSAMVEKGLNAPRTSSMGRLFDAVGVLLGFRASRTFEGQAAMAVEFAADGAQPAEPYPFTFDPVPISSLVAPSPGGGVLLDWAPLIGAILEDMEAGVPASRVAGRFHETLAEMTVAAAREAGEPRVVLTGGCFQNARLLERSAVRLSAAGFEPVCHRRVPPNDNGIALGQVVAAAGVCWPEES